MKVTREATWIALVAGFAPVAYSRAQSPVPVTVENFIRAESDLYFTTVAVKEGRFGKLGHNREVADVDNQTIVRLNRDTLYSSGVFDLDAGPVTITLPDAGDRFMSLQVITEDQYTPAIYDTRPHTFTRERSAPGTSSSASGHWSIPLILATWTPSTPCRTPSRSSSPAAPEVRDTGLGPSQPEEDPRCARRPREHPHRHQPVLRNAGRGRSGRAADLGGGDLGRQSAQGRDLPQLHPADE